MAAIVPTNFYTITNFSHFHNYRFFRISCKTPTLSPLHYDHHHLHHRRRRLFVCEALSKPNNYESEEQLWRREEQRWLREEQRWLREEARWNTERQSLLRQISELSLQIQHLQSKLDNLRKIQTNSADFNVDFEVTLTKMAAFLQSKDFNQISDSSNLEVEAASLDNSADMISVSSVEREKEEEKKPLKKVSSSLSLRMGAEGEDVRALQEALMNLGFYSGEEDMEFSSFSNGTERAVKTWQASIGIREDGIMTAELLERLYSSQTIKNSSPSSSSVNDDILKDEANGAPIIAKEVQQTVAKEGQTDVEVSQHRVFLLGENRWEEPSRLNKGNEKLGGRVKAQSSAPKCLVCRGEGRLMCMECDGTGDPNIEEQFLDWVEDGAKCPYCEGLGYTICDLCDGKSVA